MRKPWKIILWCALWGAGILSLFASSAPDGLEKVARKKGFLGRGVSLVSGLMPDYAIPGIPHGLLAASLAGVIGALAVFLLAAGVTRFIFRSPDSVNKIRNKFDVDDGEVRMKGN